MINLSALWATEWIAGGFFVYLIALAARRPLPGRHFLRVLAVGAVCTALAVMLSQLRLSPVLEVLLDWIPGVYLMQGCWLCGLFFERPMTRFEQRLIEFDHELFRRLNVSDMLARGSRIAFEYFEMTYLLVYPLVPGSFAVFYRVGARGQADRFWAALLIAGSGPTGCCPGFKRDHPGPSNRRVRWTNVVSSFAAST